LDPAAGEDLDALGTCHAAAIQGLIPFGERTGQRTLLWGENEEINRIKTPRTRKKLCADHDGYSLHASVHIGGCNAPRRERLARYVARGPIAADRLSVNQQGDIVYRFRNPWRNGKQAVVMDPMTFLSRLAALIPPLAEPLRRRLVTVSRLPRLPLPPLTPIYGLTWPHLGACFLLIRYC
jgi:hypothetical protein